MVSFFTDLIPAGAAELKQMPMRDLVERIQTAIERNPAFSPLVPFTAEVIKVPARSIYWLLGVCVKQGEEDFRQKLVDLATNRPSLDPKNCLNSLVAVDQAAVERLNALNPGRPQEEMLGKISTYYSQHPDEGETIEDFFFSTPANQLAAIVKPLPEGRKLEAMLALLAAKERISVEQLRGQNPYLYFERRYQASS